MIAGISRQGHAQGLSRQLRLEDKIPTYLGFIDQVRAFHPGMGLRAIYEQFEPEGIGRDAFIALGLGAGYRLKTYRSAFLTTRQGPGRRFPNLMRNLVLTDVNHVWLSDLTYYRLGEAHWYIVLIMDAYSRRILGYSVADNMRAENNLRALNMALSLREVNHYEQALVHHSDRGSQYTSDSYTGLLEERGIRISMCRSALENAVCERLNGIIKNQYLHAWKVKTVGELKRRLPQAVHNYNHRNHGGIGKITPIDFELELPRIPIQNRIKMKIFTLNEQTWNSAQLSLF